MKLLKFVNVFWNQGFNQARWASQSVTSFNARGKDGFALECLLYLNASLLLYKGKKGPGSLNPAL